MSDSNNYPETILDDIGLKLWRRALEGLLSALIIFIAHFPGGFSAALVSRALRGSDYAAIYIVIAAILLLALGPWRNRIYAWFARSAIASNMGL